MRNREKERKEKERDLEIDHLIYIAGLRTKNRPKTIESNQKNETCKFLGNFFSVCKNILDVLDIPMPVHQ